MKSICGKKLNELFEQLCDEKFIFSDEFNIRDFEHLCDFQKFFLHSSLEYFTYILKLHMPDACHRIKNHMEFAKAGEKDFNLSHRSLIKYQFIFQIKQR